MMTRRYVAIIAGVAILVACSCARYEDRIQTELLPEPELYALGMEKFNSEDWDAAVATFDRYERLYVNSPRVQEVRLKRADAHFNKGRTSSLIIAKSEYQSFLALYPRYEREDYIWLQIAKCSFNQMLPANRDQSPTRAAIEDLENFLDRFPDSSHVPEAREYLQRAYKNLAEHNIVVGDHYFGRKIFPAAASRYKAAIQMNVELDDPEAILYRLTVSQARTSTHYGTLYSYLRPDAHEELKIRYRENHEQALYDAKRYLEEYKSRFPENTGRISTLQSEINLVKELPAEQ